MKEKENRTRRYTIRFTEKEDIEFKKRLTSAGYKSIAKFIRDCTLGKNPKFLSKHYNDEND